jgi:hypothetical protein
MKRSESTINSHLDVSLRMRFELLMFECWLIRTLLAKLKSNLIPVGIFSMFFSPSSLGVMVSGLSMALDHINAGIRPLNGFSGLYISGGSSCPWGVTVPDAPPPGIPTFPVMAHSAMVARIAFSPPEVRCTPRPGRMQAGFVVAYSTASDSITSAGTPQIFSAHAGVFSTPSFFPKR